MPFFFRGPEAGQSMQFLLWLMKLALFVFVVAFAVKNTEPVAVHYYFGGEWQAPLVFVMLVAFCAGVAAGLFAGLTQIFRQRREISALKRALQAHMSNGGSRAGPATHSDAV
jgi:lipopolysaccharide assembly protein A